MSQGGKMRPDLMGAAGDQMDPKPGDRAAFKRIIAGYDGPGALFRPVGDTHDRTAGILYDVYVRSICAEGVYSIWSNATSFETPDDGTEGIDDIATAAIALYPNPASTTVTLTGIDGGAKVTVVDMNGRVVGEYTAKGKTLTIDLAGYAQGAYFVRITGEQVNAIRKLMVK